jgi:(p)ppGpp synthase/HD superfamily hydrolase
MEDWIRVLNAADTAARWHVEQHRKGRAQEPYINHLLEVASLVSEATGGTDPNLIIAALLHDAIEDQQVPAELIAATFGNDVADLVKEVSDDKTLPKGVRNCIKSKPPLTNPYELNSSNSRIRRAILGLLRRARQRIGPRIGNLNTSRGRSALPPVYEALVTFSRNASG